MAGARWYTRTRPEAQTPRGGGRVSGRFSCTARHGIRATVKSEETGTETGILGATAETTVDSRCRHRCHVPLSRRCWHRDQQPPQPSTLVYIWFQVPDTPRSMPRFARMQRRVSSEFVTVSHACQQDPRPSSLPKCSLVPRVLSQLGISVLAAPLS